jgi:predicted Zn-dependent protease
MSRTCLRSGGTGARSGAPAARRRRLLAAVAALGLVAGLGTAARAQSEAAGSGITQIRDAEIEQYLRQWELPVWKVAGLDPDAMHIILISDNQINSFVAGGQNIFVYTGLLTRSDDANQVIGVMAHETGHVYGGDLARMADAIRKAQIAQIIGMIAGAAAGVATGNGTPATAGMAIGQSYAERNFLSFSRSQEGAADKAATTFLNATGQSPRGLLQFMQKIQNDENVLGIREVPYVMTHPLTQDRIDTLKYDVSVSKYADAQEPAAYKEQHARMVAKLVGFLSPPSEVFEKYPETDNSVASRYARAIADHRMSNNAQALQLIDGLIAQAPNDPFFRELKGQFLFESGHVAESVAPYERADQLLPRNALIESEMAQTMIESGNAAYDRKALDALNDSAGKEPDNPLTWRLLATIYGREGKENEAILATAEQEFADGNYKEAKGRATYVARRFPFGSPGALRAQDLAQAADQALKDSQ